EGFYRRHEELLAAHAWYWENSRFQLHPVGLLRPNDHGLFDIQGNVSEWCADFIQGMGSKEQIFGGISYLFSALDGSRSLRSAHPDYKHPSVGFRIAVKVRP